MSDQATLARNQAVLWARDILSRPDQIAVVVGNTGPDGIGADSGTLLVCDLEGKPLLSVEHAEQAPLQPSCLLSLRGKELVVAGLPENFASALAATPGLPVQDLLSRYRQYTKMGETRLAPGIGAKELVIWSIEAIHKMASTTLDLDQADTGNVGWTSAHFKPNPTMLSKLRSLIKD